MRIDASRVRALQSLVRAAGRVPFYRDLWRGQGVEMERLQLPDAFDRLPVVSKHALLAAEVEDRLDPRYRRQRLIEALTSGSTGEPLRLLNDPWTLRRRQLRFLRALWAAGYRPGRRLMLISSRPSHAIKRVSPWAGLARWTYADLYLPEGELVDVYRRARPQILYGPVSALVLLAQALSAGDHRPAAVISTSEQLTPSLRRIVEPVFGVNVTDFYGMTELGLILWRVGNARAYRIAGADLLLEFLPVARDAASDSGPALERLVVTDLRGGAMPMIRYDTGDLVLRDRNLVDHPIVALAGKRYDFLWRPDGSRVSPYHVDAALGELAGVMRYELIQQPDYSVDLQLATADAATAEAARDRLQHLCGEQVRIRMQQIPAELSSLSRHKLRPVQSRVAGAAVGPEPGETA